MTAPREFPRGESPAPGESLPEDQWEAGSSLRCLANWGTAYLEKHGVPNARNNAEWILCHAAGRSRLEIYVGDRGAVSPDVRGRFLSSIRRRAGREPLQYVLGTTEFMSLPFRTPSGVFVPRPDTEVLVEVSESKLRAMPLAPCLRVLDLCCGGGVIGVSLARRIPNVEVWAVDASARAVAAAAANAAINGVDGRVHVLQATAAVYVGTDALGERGPVPPPQGPRPGFSAVVCNPPYIASSEVPRLAPEVRDHEPIEALDGGPDGLDFYRQVVPPLPARLQPGGFAAFEVGATQGAAVTAIMERAGFGHVTIISDHAASDRVVTGTRLV